MKVKIDGVDESSKLWAESKDQARMQTESCLAVSP